MLEVRSLTQVARGWNRGFGRAMVPQGSWEGLHFLDCLASQGHPHSLAQGPFLNLQRQRVAASNLPLTLSIFTSPLSLCLFRCSPFSLYSLSSRLERPHDDMSPPNHPGHTPHLKFFNRQVSWPRKVTYPQVPGIREWTS